MNTSIRKPTHQQLHDLDFEDYPDQIDASAFIAPNATVLGNVTIGANVTILYGSVLRGDSAPLVIGDGCNLQDLVCFHADAGFPTILGKNVSVGHGAIVHGAIIEDEVLIGMRSVILTGAKIGKHSIIGSGAVVTEGCIIPPGSLVLGVPGKVVRSVTDKDIERIHHAAAHYVRVGAALKQKDPSKTK